MTGPDQGRLHPPYANHAGPRHPFCVRKARISDAAAIALLAHAAGGDVLQFILGGLSQSAAALDVYHEMVCEPGGIYSFERCVVAVAGNAVVGMANAFPAGLIHNEYPVRSPTSRDVLLKPRFELNDWKSYLLNNICVGPDHRREGVGTALLKAVVRDARRQGHASQRFMYGRTITVPSPSIEGLAFVNAAAPRFHGTSICHTRAEVCS